MQKSLSQTHRQQGRSPQQAMPCVRLHVIFCCKAADCPPHNGSPAMCSCVQPGPSWLPAYPNNPMHCSMHCSRLMRKTWIWHCMACSAVCLKLLQRQPYGLTPSSGGTCASQPRCGIISCTAPWPCDNAHPTELHPIACPAVSFPHCKSLSRCAHDKHVKLHQFLLSMCRRRAIAMAKYARTAQ